MIAEIKQRNLVNFPKKAGGGCLAAYRLAAKRPTSEMSSLLCSIVLIVCHLSVLAQGKIVIQINR